MTNFTREGLVAAGFAGFERWPDVDLTRVPTSPGVYVVLREVEGPPTFLDENPAGRFKRRDPTVSSTKLESAWVEGAQAIYIGKATNLHARLRQYRDHGQGRPVGHWGGRYIWQLADSADLVVCWKATAEDPGEVERRMLAAFREMYGQLPFANLRR